MTVNAILQATTLEAIAKVEKQLVKLDSKVITENLRDAIEIMQVRKQALG